MCHRYGTANRVTIAPRAGTDRAKSAHAAFRRTAVLRKAFQQR
jgi:hypothetical protein